MSAASESKWLKVAAQTISSQALCLQASAPIGRTRVPEPSQTLRAAEARGSGKDEISEGSMTSTNGAVEAELLRKADGAKAATSLTPKPPPPPPPPEAGPGPHQA